VDTATALDAGNYVVTTGDGSAGARGRTLLGLSRTDDRGAWVEQTPLGGRLDKLRAILKRIAILAVLVIAVVAVVVFVLTQVLG
ncbi:MAG TPA: hypothetical protein PKA58_32670, partial [Polyangium sp.]|nr:hypothetical protein [Polyangium sp.]